MTVILTRIYRTIFNDIRFRVRFKQKSPRSVCNLYPVHYFSTSSRRCGPSSLRDSTVRFLDSLHHDFQIIHQELFPSPGEPAPTKNPVDLEKLSARYRRLQRAGNKIDARIQKNSDIEELDKMLQDAMKAKDSELMKMVTTDLKKCQEELSALEDQILEIMVPDEGNDISESILEINAGVGGQEAMLFTAELYNMYQNYAAFRGWSFVELNYDESDIGGVRSARAEICGSGSFQVLRFEGGVHRVQRVPKTEKFGRVQTSTTTVAILPKPPDIDIVLHKSELRIETCRSQGKGGQNVNKLDTAVRVVHLPTGVAVECQEERDQLENKKRALSRLAALLYQRQIDAQIEKQSSARKIQSGSSARSDKIRTYNFVQDRVTDHRLGENFHNLLEIMKGQSSYHDLGQKVIKEDKREAVEEMIAANEESRKRSSS